MVHTHILLALLAAACAFGAAPTPVRAQTGPSGTGLSADELYTNAHRAYLVQNYPRAIRGLQAFLAQFPQDRRVPEVHFLLANAYYGQRDYPRALSEFDLVFRSFPDAPQAPEAMRKQGQAYLLVQDPQGCRVLRELVAKYPHSPDASMARRDLLPTYCQ